MYEDLATMTAFGFSLVAILYYLNQALKRSGYIPKQWMLGATLIESAGLVGLYLYVPAAFKAVVAALGLAVAVTMFHAGIKDKAKEPAEK